MTLENPDPFLTLETPDPDLTYERNSDPYIRPSKKKPGFRSDFRGETGSRPDLIILTLNFDHSKFIKMLIIFFSLI